MLANRQHGLVAENKALESFRPGLKICSNTYWLEQYMLTCLDSGCISS